MVIGPGKLVHHVDEPTRPRIVRQQKLLQRRAFLHAHRCQQVLFLHSVILDHLLRKARLRFRSEEPPVRIAAREFPSGAVHSRKQEVEAVNEVLSGVLPSRSVRPTRSVLPSENVARRIRKVVHRLEKQDRRIQTLL